MIIIWILVSALGICTFIVVMTSVAKAIYEVNKTLVGMLKIQKDSADNNAIETAGRTQLIDVVIERIKQQQNDGEED